MVQLSDHYFYGTSFEWLAILFLTNQNQTFNDKISLDCLYVYKWKILLYIKLSSLVLLFEN
jgi:hypothetical protein